MTTHRGDRRKLEQRLAEAEDVVDSLRRGQVDAVVGENCVAVLRPADADRVLRRNQTRLQVALAASGGGLYECSVSPGESCYIDERWAEILGCRLHDVPRSSAAFMQWRLSRIHPEDRLAFEQYQEQFVSGKSAHFDTEVRMKHEAGEWIWIRDMAQASERDENGAVTCLVGIMYNITAQKRTEEDLKASRAAALNVMEDAVAARRESEETAAALTASEARLRALIDNVPFDFWAMDADGRYIIQNPASEAGCGKRVGKTIEELDIPPAVAAQWQSNNARAFSGDVVDEEVSYRRGGETRFYRNIIAPIYAGDQIQGILGVNIDITDRKRVEAALKEINDTLEQRVAERTEESERRAGQLQALAVELSQAEQRERRRLAHILHDDLQQYLAAARLPLGLLQAQLDNENLLDAARRADQCIETAIAASQSLAHDLCPRVLSNHGFAGALEWAAENCREKLRLQVDVNVEHDVEPPDEQTKHLLFSAVRELLFNVHKHANTRRATISMDQTGDVLRISVEDDGAGCDADAIDSQQRSAGFGWFSIRERLAATGGWMTVDSKPGEGTRITMYTPLQPVSAPENVEPVEAPGDRRGTSVTSRHAVHDDAGARIDSSPGIRILLVDDHDVVRESLATMLDAEPDMAVVGQTDNGAAILELAEELRPHLVVMDVALTNVDGVAATRQLKKQMPGITVVALSMYDNRDIQRRMLAAGASAYLSKSGPARELLAAIRKLHA